MTSSAKGSSRIAKELLFGIADIVLINLAWIFSYMLIYDDFSLYQAFNFIGDEKSRIIFIAVFTVVSVLIHFSFGLYRSIWQFAGMWELLRAVGAGFIDTGLFLLLIGLSFNRKVAAAKPAYFIFLFFLITFVLLVSRFSYRALRTVREHWQMRGVKQVRIMIIGAGSASETVIREMKEKKSVRNFIPVCIIDDDRSKIGTTLHSVPVVGNRDTIIENAQKRRIDEIWQLSQRRLYMLASVKLYLYSPPRKPLNPVVWLMVNTGASWFTGTRLCFVFMKVSPGANLNSRCASVVLIFPCPI